MSFNFKKNVMKKIFAFFLFTSLLTSCSQRMMDFTIISSKNVELSKFASYERADIRVEGEDTKPIIIIVPTGYPDGKEALDNAIESFPGAVALLDGVFTYKWFYIPYIYGQYRYVIEGTPLYDPVKRAAIENQVNDYSVCILDKDGNIEKNVQLQKSDYIKFKSEVIKNTNRATKKLIKQNS